ncbi:hypothetical protein N7456_004845 [Penicillium angulare]|uniref:Uncharacterized protein n=1 Tax=Penicillium angulare TaxID=116970 RepID=A0A9W9FY85_9EURO|nr:hypothetical protein N7456_004845 [Penicillium angulare]
MPNSAEFDLAIRLRHVPSLTGLSPIRPNREEPSTPTSLDQANTALDESRSDGPWKDRIRQNNLIKPPATPRSIDAETYPATAKAFSKASKNENSVDLPESDSEDLDYTPPLKSHKRSSLAESDSPAVNSSP